jgi:hypothetical protein
MPKNISVHALRELEYRAAVAPFYARLARIGRDVAAYGAAYAARRDARRVEPIER